MTPLIVLLLFALAIGIFFHFLTRGYLMATIVGGFFNSLLCMVFVGFSSGGGASEKVLTVLASTLGAYLLTALMGIPFWIYRKGRLVADFE